MKKWVLMTLAASLSASSIAQDRFAEVMVIPKQITDNVYMLTGAGGNIGVSSGEDGVLIVDDQYAPLAEKIVARLKEINDSPVRYVINTHYHGDHTGSNAYFQGEVGSTVFAHENVRIRLASGEGVDNSALPVVTYQDGIKFHMNGDTIHVMHLPTGHTDGDSVVWFENANVLHAGDLFFKDIFPYIDLGAGGDVKGFIASVETILEKIDDTTQVIPGHGGLASKEDLQRSVDMIKETYAYVQKLKADGKTEADVLEMGLEEKWKSWSWRFITEERWIKTLYQ